MGQAPICYEACTKKALLMPPKKNHPEAMDIARSCDKNSAPLPHAASTFPNAKVSSSIASNGANRAKSIHGNRP